MTKKDKVQPIVRCRLIVLREVVARKPDDKTSWEEANQQTLWGLIQPRNDKKRRITNANGSVQRNHFSPHSPIPLPVANGIGNALSVMAKPA